MECYISLLKNFAYISDSNCVEYIINFSEKIQNGLKLILKKQINFKNIFSSLR